MDTKERIVYNSMLSFGFSIIVIIGIILLSTLGINSLIPVVTLIGSLITGFETRKANYGAFIGGFIALTVGIILPILPILFESFQLENSRVLILILLISPIIGAFGGILGGIILGEKPELPDLPVCLSCGKKEYALFKYCSNCGSRLQRNTKSTTYPTANQSTIGYLDPANHKSNYTRLSKPRILSGFEGLRRIPPPIKNTILCSSCKTPNDPGAHFCGKCGTALK